MIIDYTFFQDGLLRVDGAIALAAPSATNEGIKNAISSFIEKYEPEYLNRLLGDKLCSDFLKSHEERVYKWDELETILVTGDSFKCSPIANYVYFFMLRSFQADATINGVKADHDEGSLISPQQKMIEAWNDMVKMNKKVVKWLENANLKDWELDYALLETINRFGI